MIIRNRSGHKPDPNTPRKCKCGEDTVELKGKCLYPVGHYGEVRVPGGEGCRVAGYPYAMDRIYEVWVTTSNDIWSDVWGETIPPVSEFIDVIRDVSYDRYTKEDTAYYNRMSEKAKNLIIKDVM